MAVSTLGWRGGQQGSWSNNDGSRENLEARGELELESPRRKTECVMSSHHIYVTPAKTEGDMDMRRSELHTTRPHNASHEIQHVHSV